MTRRAAPFREARICACGEVGFVGLTMGLVAMFSPESLPLVAGRCWYASADARQGFKRAYAKQGKRGDLMHRLVTGAAVGQIVDHQFHDTLDNRLHLLRICNHTQNKGNSRAWAKETSSRFKGVSTEYNKWRAYIYKNGKQIRLGLFESEVEAARRYDVAAIDYFGEFALTNASLGLLPSGAGALSCSVADVERVAREEA